MKVTKLKGSDKISGLCQLAVKGKMTIHTADEMLDLFSVYWQEYKQFTLDLSEISEIDTAGIQVLLQFHRKAKQVERSVQILSCSQVVKEQLILYRLEEKFDVQVV